MLSFKEHLTVSGDIFGCLLYVLYFLQVGFFFIYSFLLLENLS